MTEIRANEHAQPRQKLLFLMVGYPGSGKTTTAKILHELTGAEHMWVDERRKHLFGEPSYSDQENLELYRLLNQEVADMLARGKSVVYDTNFNYYKDRQLLANIAQAAGAQTIVVHLQTPTEVAYARATHEAHLHATRILGAMEHEHFMRIAQHFEPLRPDETSIVLDGTKINAKYVRAALAYASL